MNLWKSFFIFYINMRHEKRSILEVNISLKCKLPEAVARRCSVKKVFLKISQISQENTYFRVSFLIKPQVCNFIKKEALTRVFFCEFCEISKNTFFIEHLWWLLLYIGNRSMYIYCFTSLLSRMTPKIVLYKYQLLHVKRFL